MRYTFGILGALGRMGHELCALAQKDSEVSLLLYRRGDDLIDFLKRADVVIDFSSNEATASLLEASLHKSRPLVIGTTGLKEKTHLLLKQASSTSPILYSANFSLGIAACLAVIKPLCDMLCPHFSFIIEEKHHIHKKDSPSGTALALSEASGHIPHIESIREGEGFGEHKLLFINEAEKIELSHTALSRKIFAQGALYAAKHMHAKPCGLYSLKDLF